MANKRKKSESTRIAKAQKILRKKAERERALLAARFALRGREKTIFMR